MLSSRARPLRSSIRRLRAPNAGLAAAIAVPVLLPLVVFWKALSGRSLLAPGDGFVYYLPVHILTADAWRAGIVPAWNEYAFSGSPLLAAAQAGPFYPPNVLFTLLPPLYANNLVLLLDVAIAGLGAFALARKLTSDDVAGAVAGVAFVSSGFVYGHIAHQSIEASIAWLPWALYGYELLRERRTAGRLLLTSGAIALSLLGGHYQMSFFTVLAVGLYAVAVAVLERPRARSLLPGAALAVALVAVAQSAVPASSSWRVVAFRDFDAVALLLAVVAGLWWALRRYSRGRRRPSAFFWALPGALAAGFALAAVQFVPTFRILGQTLRAGAGLEYVTEYSFAPSHLVLLLFPYLFGTDFPSGPFHAAPYRGSWNLTELAGYPGLACAVLAAAGWARSRKDPRAVALAVVAAISLLIALGASTSAGLLVWHTPPYGRFRAWARYVVVLDLAIAVLAAYGVAHLRASRGRDLRAACVRAWLAVGVLLGTAIVVPLLPPVSRHVAGGATSVLAVAVPCAAAIGAAILCLLFGRAGRVAGALCCLLVALDGFLSFGGFFEWRQAPSVASARAAYSSSDAPPWGATPDARGGIDRYLFAGHDVAAFGRFSAQVTAVKGLRAANGLDPLAPTPYTKLMGGMQDAGNLTDPGQFLRHRSPLLDVMRISLVLVPRDEAPRSTPPWFHSARSVGRLVRYEYRPRVADAFLVGRALPYDASLLLGPHPFDPARAALVYRGRCAACPFAGAPGPAGRVVRETRRTGAVDLDVEASRPAVLVVSEDWYPGWSATVDGRGAPLTRVDGVALGVPVAAGAHRVRFRYRAPGLTAGAAISLVTLAVLCAAALVGRRRSRKTTKRAAGIEPA